MRGGSGEGRVTQLRRAATVEDYRGLAERRLPAFLFHYVDGAAGAETTAFANQANLADIRLNQQVMANLGHIDTGTKVFGQNLSMPVALGPVGLAGILARRGEVQARRAAHKAGVPFCLSTLGICSLEEVAASEQEPLWFQVYHFRDQAFMVDLLDRVKAAGVRVLVLTVDVPVSGIRHRDRRHGLTGTWRDHAPQVLARGRWLWDVFLRGRPLSFGTLAGVLPPGSDFRMSWSWLARNFDPAMGFDHIAAVCSAWDGPVVVKGIMTRKDARAAIDAGASGLVVSNHGGRQLDGVRSSISALPEVAREAAGAVPVFFDGGIRSGIDVVRATALGADMCLLGRAWAWALAAGGERGVAQLLGDLRAEISNTMALTGCHSIEEVRVKALERI